MHVLYSAKIFSIVNEFIRLGHGWGRKCWNGYSSSPQCSDFWSLCSQIQIICFEYLWRFYNSPELMVLWTDVEQIVRYHLNKPSTCMQERWVITDVEQIVRYHLNKPSTCMQERWVMRIVRPMWSAHNDIFTNHKSAIVQSYCAVVVKISHLRLLASEK